MTIFSHAHFKKTGLGLLYKTKHATLLANVRVQDNANNYLVSIRSLPTATLRVRVGYNHLITQIKIIVALKKVQNSKGGKKAGKIFRVTTYAC